MMVQLQQTVEYLKSRGVEAPEIGIVLGTGLGRLVDKIEIEHEISYTNIPHFAIATVEYHFGKLIYGTLGGKKVVALQGRYHYYEGYSMDQIVFPVRVMKVLGVKSILLSNAAGAVNLDFDKGDLMLVEDHINLQPENPLRGPNLDDLGPRFPDMSQPYSKELNEQMKIQAKKCGLNLREGVYASVQGPNLETRAEYRWLRSMGADAVGMSTVPEVIACNHMGVPCACISVITDVGDPDNLEPVNIEEIIAVAGKAEVKLTQLLTEMVREL
jgi:purine-nucleoside phosphorylase